MAHDDFSPVLQAFGESLGVQGLALDDCQSCSLSIGETLLTMQWKADSGVLLVYAPVGLISKDAMDRHMLISLLEANCLGMGTGGLALGLHPGLGAVILSGQVPGHGLNPVALERFAEFFVAMAEEWRGRLAEAPGGHETVSRASAEPADLGRFAGVRI
jgi:hypothetical protein